MSKPRKRANGKYVEVGYEDKIVFQPKGKIESRAGAVAAWRRSQGLWADHPVFQGMTVKEVVEWFRGGDKRENEL